MRNFYKYLLHKGYSNSTIKQHEKNVGFFLNWLSTNDISINHCGYHDMIRFIDNAGNSLQNSAIKKSNVNRLLNSISYYVDCISEDQPLLRNPARIIRVKSYKRRIAHDILEYSELIRLYRFYKLKTPRHVRNKVILGLLIFQGLTYHELKNLCLDDLRFDNGVIFIGGNRNRSLKRGTTARELLLEAIQMVDLIEYLNNIRPKILSGRYLNYPGKRPRRKIRARNTNQLILSLKGSPHLKNTLHHLFIDLKKQNPKIKSARQLRQSAISYWLTKYNLRNVQYMAGHRYVSSTEWYKRINIEDLKREINIYHPLKREL